MAGRHQPGPKDPGAALTEHVIRKPASKEGGQINKPGIETINLRCEGLHAEWAEHAFEHAAQYAKADDIIMAGAAAGTPPCKGRAARAFRNKKSAPTSRW